MLRLICTIIGFIGNKIYADQAFGIELPELNEIFSEGLLGKNKRLGYYGSLPATITDKVYCEFQDSVLTLHEHIQQTVHSL